MRERKETIHSEAEAVAKYLMGLDIKLRKT